MSSRRLARILVSALLGGVLVVQPSMAADPDKQTVAAAWLAGRFGGIAQDYELEAQRYASIPESGEIVWAAKFLDRRTADLRLVYESQDGQVGGEEILTARATASLTKLDPLQRKADGALRDALSTAGSNDLLPVGIWIDADTNNAVEEIIAQHPDITWIGDRPQSSDISTIRKLRGEIYTARQGVFRLAESRIGEAARALGARVGYGSTSVPLLFAELNPAGLAQIANMPEVVSLGLNASGWELTMRYAGPTVQADWTSGTGDQGTGIRVADVEYYNVRETGDLAGQVVAFHSTTGTIRYDTAGLDHPSWVAGAVASLDATYKGVAPGADIVSSSTGGGSLGITRDEAVISAADWAVSPPPGGDADIVNTSLEEDTAQGRDEARAYFDSIGGGQTYRLSVSSAGNYGEGPDGTWYVGSPGIGWNVLAVGGTDDKNTSSWTGDVLWYVTSPCCSGAQYKDKAGTYYNPHGDFNKPDVSAPAFSVQTANGWSASGTSIAAPMVAGIAAQLLANNPSLLTWPEVLRAVIMAAAIHRTPLPGGGTSMDHEGVGTVSAKWANRILVENGGTYGGYIKGTMFSSTTVDKTFTASAGQNVRVVLAWDSHTSGGTFSKTDTLTADLDLFVTDASGSPIEGSISWDNSYEFVDFTAPTTSTYHIQVAKPRFDASSEYYAIAWVKWTSP